MKTFVLFGDSLLARFGRNHILHLEEIVKDITVHNCATNGFNTRDGLKRVGLIAQLKPDFVCLSFGANDSYPVEGKFVPLPEFKNNLLLLIKNFPDSKVILFPCPPIHDPSDLKDSEEFNKVLNQYNQVIKDVGLETGASFIDSKNIYGELLKRGEAYHVEDGLHLNDLGYQVLIKELIMMIK